MNDIVIYGAGGFGREVACMIRAINKTDPQWRFIGFIDDGLMPETKNSQGGILGGIDFLNSYPQNIAVAIAIANPVILEQLVSKISNPNVWFPNLFAPNTIIFDANTFKKGQGNILFFGCRISCDVKIGNFNLFNGAVSLGHDAILGDFNVLQPSTRISGDCVVGNCNFFGVQSVVLQGLKIGNSTRIGAGSVVMRNTKDNSLYFGNPAKIVTGF
jgi:sugar O-acyltransferase (sialic acid O-acetyltransferase NeuD family)